MLSWEEATSRPTCEILYPCILFESTFIPNHSGSKESIEMFDLAVKMEIEAYIEMLPTTVCSRFLIFGTLRNRDRREGTPRC